ncbi:unnamed protein product [Linum tenue]|uniref:Uncharacterized protein n=1 Tax=Linum tenue TaxID=586396 RepID=A0AAV0RDF3_9ROSI|nr:unnamed protein product [Linum tenue]
MPRGIVVEEDLCLLEFVQFLLDHYEQERFLEQIRNQTPWNWKFIDFERRQRRLLRGHTKCGSCIGKEEATVTIRFFLGCRIFLEEQAFFGGINFDPLLTNLFLFPVAGVVAIALSETCTAPLNRITILSQLGMLGGEGEEVVKDGIRRRRSMSEQAAQIVEQEGGRYAALWRGNLVSIAHRLSFYSINIFAYLGFRALLMWSSVAMKPASLALVSGGLAAFTATSVSHPLDTLTTRIIALQRIVPSMAITFTVYEGLSFALSRLRPNGSFSMTAIVGGSIAGLAASAATYPIDLVQKRMQSEDGGREREGRRRRGVWQMFGQIIEEEGVEGLYKGIRPHCFKTALGLATALVTYEIVKVPSYIALRKPLLSLAMK